MSSGPFLQGTTFSDEISIFRGNLTETVYGSWPNAQTPLEICLSCLSHFKSRSDIVGGGIKLLVNEVNLGL